MADLNTSRTEAVRVIELASGKDVPLVVEALANYAGVAGDIVPGVSVREYVGMLVANYAWRVAQKELKYLASVGVSQYIAERREVVARVAEKAKAAGTVLGGIARKGEQVIDYAEDVIGYDSSMGSSIETEVYPVTPPGSRQQIYPSSYSGNGVEVVAGLPPHTHDGRMLPAVSNPFERDATAQHLLAQVKLIFPPRAGEVDAKYFARVTEGVRALTMLMNGRYP